LTEIKRRMASGKMPVEAHFPSGEAPETGALAFIDNAVDRTTGTIKLKAEFSNAALRLWPGQFINVALTLSTQSDVVVVPSDAIQIGPEGQQVFVVKENKTVDVRRVTVGREGQFLLGPGSRVEIKQAAGEGAEEKSGEGRKQRAELGKAKAAEQGAS